MQKRLPYLDLASGIMTVWVLYFHALCPFYDGNILNHIPFLYFFMPWFFYKSGMMFSPKDTKVEWHNGIKKLLKTFAIWSFIGYIAHLLWHWYIGDLTLRLAFYTPLRSLFLSCSVPMNGAVWFLPVLFLVRQIGNYLLPRVKALWIVLATLVLCIFFQFVSIPFLPAWISSTAWGLFFFAFAYWIREYENNKWLIFLSSVVYVVSLFTPISYVYGGGAPLWSRIVYYPSCALACVFFNNVCRWLVAATEQLEKVHIHWHFPVWSYVGKNAMAYYVPHYMLFRLTFDILARHNETWYSGWQGLVIVTIIYAVVLTAVSWIYNRKAEKQALKVLS